MSEIDEAQPTIADLLRAAIERASRQMRVCIPAVVVSFDSERVTCSAQPLIDEPQPNGGHVADAVVMDVPVMYPGTKSTRIRFPLAKGDQVMLHFMDRAASEWRLSLQSPEATSPRQRQPAERRWHDFTDVVAYPMATAEPERSPVATDRTEIQHGEVTLALTDDGKILAHDGDPAQALALATKADLDDLKTVIQNVTPSAGDGGAAIRTAILSNWTPDGTSVLRAR